MVMIQQLPNETPSSLSWNTMGQQPKFAIKSVDKIVTKQQGTEKVQVKNFSSSTSKPIFVQLL